MTNRTVDYESCFDTLQGQITPSKRMPSENSGSASGKRRTQATPESSQGDRFIPNRSAMDLDVSHFELTRGDGGTENNVNASPAKEDCTRTPPGIFSAAGRQKGEPAERES